MKLFFGLLIILGFGSSAQATHADGCMDTTGCTVAIAVDSGNSSKKCEATDVDCECSVIAAGCGYYLSSSYCSYPKWTDYGGTVTGKRCCVLSTCRDGVAELQDEVATEKVESSDTDLETVFGERTSYFFGVVNSSNRSPTHGRSVSSEAKLDACIGHGNTDSIKSLAAFQQLSTCRGSSYCGSSLQNQYCTTIQANGESLCQDRCDCVFSGTCNNY